jgi:hypothetical protein
VSAIKPRIPGGDLAVAGDRPRHASAIARETIHKQYTALIRKMAEAHHPYESQGFNRVMKSRARPTS